MPSAVQRRPFLTLEPFLDFYGSRPDGERWELIDGAPITMPPPRIEHQRIASNLQRQLSIALAERRPTWHADSQIGVVSPDVDTFRPEPDVAVVDTQASIPSRFMRGASTSRPRCSRQATIPI